MTRRRLLIVLTTLIVLFGLAGTGLANLVVYDLSRPRPAQIPPRTALGDFPVEEVDFQASDGISLSGWHVKVPGKKAVVLLHGIGANRLQHVKKTELFAELGYAVLSYDARGHGASQATTVTGGWTERLDLKAAIAYMRGQGYEHIGLVGFSMGAATITYANQEILKPDFIVLESCFKDVDTLIHNAVGWMSLPSFFALPVLRRIASKIDVPVADLSPVRRMAEITAPTLILLGDNEFQVNKSQAEEMFEACPARIKRMFVFEQAGHDVFSETQADNYKMQLSEFLRQMEQQETGS